VRPGIRGRASATSVPHPSRGLSNSGSWGSGAPEKVNYRPRQITGQQPNGSRRPARKPISPGRPAPRLSWRVPGGWQPGLKERAHCPSLAADRFEASHCPAPVAGERQPRPRSHDRGHAVHPFIGRPAPHAHVRARTEPAVHMAAPAQRHLPCLIKFLAHPRRPGVMGGSDARHLWAPQRSITWNYWVIRAWQRECRPVRAVPAEGRWSGWRRIRAEGLAGAGWCGRSAAGPSCRCRVRWRPG
jgi:hypothetical protein